MTIEQFKSLSIEHQRELVRQKINLAIDQFWYCQLKEAIKHRNPLAVMGMGEVKNLYWTLI